VGDRHAQAAAPVDLPGERRVEVLGLERDLAGHADHRRSLIEPKANSVNFCARKGFHQNETDAAFSQDARNFGNAFGR
jgi:hypothetical protein